MTRGEWLDREQQAAWRAWLEGSALLDEALGRDLLEVGLTLGEYDILVQLSEQTTRSLRMSELAELVDPERRLQVRHPSGWTGPAFEAGELLVWGFTAGLLDKLLELGGWALPWDTSRRRTLDPAMVTLAARGATFPAGPPEPASA